MLYWIFYYLINTFLTHLMKKFFMTLAAVASMVFSANIAFAQDGAPQSLAELTAAQPEVPLFQAIKSYFIQGGATFMALIIICLIIGLALSIERILTLSFAKKNPETLVKKVKDALKKGGKDEAIKVCEATKGPVADMMQQGLKHLDEDLDVIEASVVSEGEVQQAENEKGLSWISLFIGIAPSLGFLGTVIGMVQAFDAIESAGDISPNIVAGGMKVALITTIGGLIVAMILQVFYNYILSKIENLSKDMTSSSLNFMDAVREYKKN